ncbi:hypothetical protein [Agromyces kandeliae]|uniref:Uncharacterized protein n=1 Tax=Agromyces kandeliae TaxID=2666141 RepID=A0A6L5R5B1_9MICO|nr:hypothetical protein [Agromyces kandeliae]MRX44764.1 hypothetical protein [Agromyces kandeliae]
MSKNEHMHSQTAAIVGCDRETIGVPSLVQGAYGRRGNLELVACDGQEGLWVFWFNADLESDPLETPEVPPGSWSSGLRFAPGTRFVAAQILQSALGPDHLEVLALADHGELQSWYWSPGPGFRLRAEPAARGVTAFRAVHSDGVLSVSAMQRGGLIAHVRSDGSGYPERTWTTVQGGPGLDEPGPTVDVADARETGATGLREVRSSRDGGTIEATWRDAQGRIRHLGIPSP